MTTDNNQLLQPPRILKPWRFITDQERNDLIFLDDQKELYEQAQQTINNLDYVKICNAWTKVRNKLLAEEAETAKLEAKLHAELPDYPHVKLRSSGDAVVQTHPENTEHLFVNVLGISIRWNDLTKDMELNHNQAFLNNGYSSDNNEAITFAEGLATEYGLPVTRGALINHVALIGKKYRYHPVYDYLTQLKWDGKSRLPEIMQTLTLSEDANVEVCELLLRRWLVMCVAAILNSKGISPQGALVLQGPQGIGKTTWLKRLLPNQDWFCEGMQLDPRNKDDVIQFVRNWVVELGEIDATFRKADIAALKAFVTRDTDEYRPPYGATIEKYPRRTCFSGTVNDMEFLSDDENRRFWVLPITHIERDHGIDLDQLWAEIVVLYRNNEPYWLNQSEIAKLQQTNQQFKKLTPLEQRLEDAKVRAFDPRTPHKKSETPLTLTLTEIFELIGVKNYSPADIMRLKKYLTNKKVNRSDTDKSKWVICATATDQ